MLRKGELICGEPICRGLICGKNMVHVDLYVARLRFSDSRFFSDSDFFEPLFWGLIYCLSDTFLKLMLQHT